ncbi:Tetratricopeptide-like helical [Penicillium brevicompactum]|uniref:Tetratricopeptide-like helical n=1 Tax=Penicillium brevicompactum TaxID=5074 RepID=UPI002540F743|nr:Tetratricopeptide-like helical [Penicillium brevicompactum]KAJ5336604.1 Tetratricopeptide-like helical [Penicillium brevicompactum]
MSSKAALKAVRAALESKDYQGAAEKAQALVNQDPQNYHAHVFLGLANDKLNRNDSSETAYITATRIKADDKAAWQGLLSLYDRQGGDKLDSYHQVVIQLGNIFANNDERERCQDLVNKYAKLAASHGSKAQRKSSLMLQLPSSPLYDFLEGRLPHPSHTYLRLIELTEGEEREFINREIGERRTRLGARIDKVTQEVKREAFEKSALDQLYRGIVDWTNDDDVRRRYEEKLFERAYEDLCVSPADQKEEKKKLVFKAAQDMVIIKHPFEPAWKVFLTWQDVQNYAEYDVGHLREYVEFFPESGISKILKGFLSSELSPFPNEPHSEEKAPGENKKRNKPAAENDVEVDLAENDVQADKVTAAQDRLILMVEGLESAGNSIIAHRIMSDLYLHLEEYESVVNVARKGLSTIKDLTKACGVKIPNTADALNIALANALIHHQAPRHHTEAKIIFNSILERFPLSCTCLLGVGLILKEDQDYAEAVDFLRRALERDTSNLTIRGELAWCEALNGDLQAGLDRLQGVLEDSKETQPENREFAAEILYRIGFCQWELDPSLAARKDRKGAYSSLFASIQANMNFAPAYTILGFYFADYKKDKARARRCFHKAFELSTSEIEAAERLAKAFADSQEWDLVEAVATRVIESGKAKPSPGSKRRGFSWPYAALGTVQINKQQYSKSIVSFQAALRLAPNDYHSWVGLAESYHHSGRYIAATKAFEYAKTLEPNLSEKEQENVWFSRYMLANVRRELGEYDEAISSYDQVLISRPGDIGVSIALLQTLTESSAKSLGLGLFNDSAELACRAINLAHTLAHVQTDIFNLWKAVGDAYSHFSHMKSKLVKLSPSDCKTLLSINLDPTAFDSMTEIDGIGADWLQTDLTEETVPANFYGQAAILAYKRALHVSVHDPHAQAIAWYNLGWAEHLAYREAQSDSAQKGKKSRKFLKAAMQCFKRAIELEAGNADFWNSLGVVTTTMSPKVAQHAFVRSLHLNDRNASVWTNLGALYLIHNDIQLANDSFTRAQSTDPDYAQAWVGQGILALLVGEIKEARGIFEHAFEISNSSEILPKRQYALTLFDHLLVNPSASHEVSELIQPFFALHQLCSQNPSDLPFVHLSALLAERMGETADAENSLQAVCAGMEAEFEETESTSSLSKYAQANADLARVLLARHAYEEAAEKAELALSLSGEEDAEKFDPETCRKLRLSAHLTAGLAFYYTQSWDQAIDMFRDALQEANNAPDVVCLLAQVLWAKGGEEDRSVAREQLFACLENNDGHIGATVLLGAISILDKDSEAVDAIESDLNSLTTREDVNLHEAAKLVKLRSAISALGFNAHADVPEDLRRTAQASSAIMISPAQPAGWMELSAATQDPDVAEMTVECALQSVPPRGKLEASELSKAYAQSGKMIDSLRAIMISPSTSTGWEELDYHLSTLAV